MSETRGCDICKEPIDPERIEVIPETRLCTKHAQEIRQFGGEFKLTATQERTSKAGSLKKNYGDVTTAKVRNNEAISRLKEQFLKQQT